MTKYKLKRHFFNLQNWKKFFLIIICCIDEVLKEQLHSSGGNTNQPDLYERDNLAIKY